MITRVKPAPDSIRGRKGAKKRANGRLVTHQDGRESIEIGGMSIPVLGVANCTGRPLPTDAETVRRIEEFLNPKRGA